MAKGKSKFEITDVVRLTTQYKRTLGITKEIIGVVYKIEEIIYPFCYRYYISWANWPKEKISDLQYREVTSFTNHDLEKVEVYE